MVWYALPLYVHHWLVCMHTDFMSLLLKKKVIRILLRFSITSKIIAFLTIWFQFGILHLYPCLIPLIQHYTVIGISLNMHQIRKIIKRLQTFSSFGMSMCLGSFKKKHLHLPLSSVPSCDLPYLQITKLHVSKTNYFEQKKYYWEKSCSSVSAWHKLYIIHDWPCTT